MERVAHPRTGSGPAGLLSRTLRAAAPHAWFLEDEVAGLPEFVRPGAVCLDVGAEYGLYTWTLAGLAGPTGHVHAVEPQPGPSAFVDATRRLLRASNVTVHRTALGASAVAMLDSTKMPSAHSISRLRCTLAASAATVGASTA